MVTSRREKDVSVTTSEKIFGTSLFSCEQVDLESSAGLLDTLASRLGIRYLLASVDSVAVGTNAKHGHFLFSKSSRT